jgi:predicted transcriptional regulator
MDNKDLILDLLTWISKGPKPYDEVMAAWRTSCPRLQIWEDAVDHGFVIRRQMETEGAFVNITDQGLMFLRENGRTAG